MTAEGFAAESLGSSVPLTNITTSHIIQKNRKPPRKHLTNWVYYGMRARQLKFIGLIVREKKGFSSLCLELDVASHGSSPMQAKQMLKEAVTLYLETAIENNLPYLRPVPSRENPQLTSPELIVLAFDIEINVRLIAHAA